MHPYVNNVRVEELDKAHENGSKTIDSTSTSSDTMECVEGCRLLNYNDIVESDHRAHAIEVDVEDYFQE